MPKSRHPLRKRSNWNVNNVPKIKKNKKKQKNNLPFIIQFEIKSRKAPPKEKK
jgi:hypothetical protein